MGIHIPIYPPVGCNDCIDSLPNSISTSFVWCNPLGECFSCSGTLFKISPSSFQGNVGCDNEMFYTVNVGFCGDGNSAYLDSVVCNGAWALGAGCSSFGFAIPDCSGCVEV